jgi:competence protein ComEA
MGWYTRQQLVLLLLLLCAAGVGVGVVHWRAVHPQLVDRLEQLEREIADAGETGASSQGPARVEEPRRSDQPRRGDRPARTTAPSRAPKRQTSPADGSTSPLDLNRATLADLARLPGVGPVLARRIVETRESAGPFGEIDDLLNVRGLGRTKLERLRPFVGISR